MTLPPLSRRGRRGRTRLVAVSAAMLGLVAASAIPAAAALSSATEPAAVPVKSKPKSDKHIGDADRARIAAAEAAGKKTVTLLVAAEPDRTSAAADQLRALGGVVVKSDTSVDYLKVEIPTENAEKAAKLDAIEAVDVDGLIQMDDPRTDGAQQPIPQTPPDASTPRINPYLPTGDTKAAQFALENPQFDGRGTTIAVLDSGIDLDTPSLQTTTTGQPKIVDWYNANSPTSGDGTWVTTTGRVTGTFTSGGLTWTAPATGGPYSFGLLRENAGDLPAGELGADIDRDGVRNESFGVLQDRATKRVYVDIDQDRDFTDETSMIDFKVSRDFGHFGADNPATAVVERVPFVVVTDRSNPDPNSSASSLVNIGIAGAQHGTHVAGITSANGLFGGAMSGAAPGAQLMAVKVCLTTTSCTSSGLIDGVLYAAHNGADVVNISIGGLPALNDGNNARTALYNRTIDEFDMQIFLSAGNSGAGANTVGDPAVATNSIAVGAYITRETWLANYGSDSANNKGLHPFSSRGPREDGGFKPDIVAPGAAISTTPLWQPGGPVGGTYSLPPGYSMLNGTSMAAPEATGAGALLVSAYKATFGSRPAAAALRSAIRSTADYQPQLSAYEQGAGLLSVTKAWNQLKSGKTTNTITASVPVSTVLSGQLATPNVGVGIHDREGVSLGQNYTRTYTLTRTTGPADAIKYNVQWVGNDGTFNSANNVSLGLNQPTAFPVNIVPSSTGAHSAVLQLDDPQTPGVDLMTMNAVFVPQEFTASNAFTFQVSGKVGRDDTQRYFVRVPAGASALKVDMTGGGADAGAGQIRFLRFNPQGLPVDSNASTSCYDPDAGAGCAGGTPHSRTAVNPLPGVWELVVEARRTSDVKQAPFSLTATVLSTTISPNPDVVPSATVGTPQERTYTVTNQGAGFNGRLVGGGDLGSTQTQRPTIGHLAQQTFDVTIPAGATNYTVTTGNSTDLRADLDLFVFDCTTGTCVQRGSGTTSSFVERVSINNPAAGLWRILIDGFAVPEGTTSYDLVDTYLSAGLGSLTSADANADHPSGSSWSPTATLTVNGLPGAGRKLTGTVAVQTDAGVTVGAGSVVVDSVN
jgi:subtilisin family serine protease